MLQIETRPRIWVSVLSGMREAGPAGARHAQRVLQSFDKHDCKAVFSEISFWEKSSRDATLSCELSNRWWAVIFFETPKNKHSRRTSPGNQPIPNKRPTSLRRHHVLLDSIGQAATAVYRQRYPVSKAGLRPNILCMGSPRVPETTIPIFIPVPKNSTGKPKKIFKGYVGDDAVCPCLAMSET